MLICWTNGKTPDFYVFNANMKTFKKKRELLSGFSCQWYVYALFLPFIDVLRVREVSILCIKWNLQFYLVTCSKEIWFRKRSTLLLLSNKWSLYSVRTVGLFWDYSGASLCRSTSAINDICLIGSLCWEDGYFQWWQLRLNIFFHIFALY